MDIQKDDRKACGKEQTGDRDWKVTFEGGFYGQRGRRGIEIPVGKTFSWGKEIWHVPAVYQCGKGLVADIFAEIDPERVKAFLERYRDLEEDRLTEEEQERIQQESPLETGFQPEIVLNGRKLRGVEGNGLCWLPESCREMDAGALNDGPAEEYPELDNDGDPVEDPAAEEYPAADPYEEERRLLEHYGLDLAKAWSMNRWSFSWATKRPPKLLVPEPYHEAGPGLCSGHPLYSPGAGRPDLLYPSLHRRASCADGPGIPGGGDGPEGL